MITRTPLSRQAATLVALFACFAFSGCNNEDDTAPQGPCADGHFLNIEFTSSVHGHSVADPTSSANGVDLVHFYDDIDRPDDGGRTTLRIHDDNTGNGSSRTLDLYVGADLPEAGEYVISDENQIFNKFILLGGSGMQAYQLTQGVLTLHKAEVTRETINALEYSEVSGTFTGSFEGIDGQTGTLDLTVSFCASPMP